VSILVAGIIVAAFASSGFSSSAGRSPGRKSVIGVPRSSPTTRPLPVGGKNSWMQTNGPQGGEGIALARNSVGHVFVGTQGGGVFRSTDNAKT